MYFEDLTPYCYNLQKPLVGVFNVGWLDERHPFNRGLSPAEFVSALKIWLVHAEANQMRGFQLCRFCGFEQSKLERYRQLEMYQQLEIIIEGEKIYIGSAEVWIPSSDGVIFAAPNLIIHYVEMHKYLPPPQFMQAVMQPIPCNWEASAVAEAMIASVKGATQNGA